MRTYRIGLVGFGAIGSVHAWAHASLPYYYNPLPFRTKIVAVATAHRQTAEAAAAVCGAERASDDYRTVTESSDVDIVHICSPNNEHYQQLASAVAHEKHIYCDKPLVSDWSEVQSLLPALRGYRQRLGMAFQLRFFPATVRAAHLIAQGKLGRVLSFRVAYLHAGSADPSAPAKWKLTRSAGGGVIADLASHAVDLLAALGGEPVEMTAQSSIAYATRPAANDPSHRVPVDAEDHVVALLRAQFGSHEPALGTVEATKIATGTEDELRFEIHGSSGALRFNTMAPHRLEFYDATRAAEPVGGERGWIAIDTGQRYPRPAASFPGPKFSIGWIRSHLASIADYLFAIHEGREHRPGAVDGVYAQHLIDCLRTSCAHGRPLQPMSREEVANLLSGDKESEVESLPDKSETPQTSPAAAISDTGQAPE